MIMQKSRHRIHHRTEVQVGVSVCYPMNICPNIAMIHYRVNASLPTFEPTINACFPTAHARSLLEQERKVKAGLYESVVVGSLIKGNQVDLSRLQDQSPITRRLENTSNKSPRTERALKQLAAVKAFRAQAFDTFTTSLDLEKQRVMLATLEERVAECRALNLENDYPAMGKEFIVTAALSRSLKAQIQVIDKLSEAMETADGSNLNKYIQIVRLGGSKEHVF